MKRKGWKQRMALALCACGLAAAPAAAQVTIGWGSQNAVQGSLGSSSGYAIGHDRMAATESDLAMGAGIGGAFVITRFGYEDGRVVAFGRLVPTDATIASESLSASESGSSVVTGAGGETGAIRETRTRSGALLSSPLEPAGGYGADPRLGWGSRIAYSDVIVPSPRTDWGVNSSFDESRLGSWTGAGTGYGESGVGASSSMTSDIDGTTSFNLGRREIDLALSEDQEMLGDLELSATLPSATLETSVDRDLYVGTEIPLESSTLELLEDRPLIQLGGSAGLYTSAEAERALLVSGSSEDLAIPVTVVGASCDAVSLSFADGAEIVTVSSLDGGSKLGTTLCALSEAASTPVSEGQSALIVKHLNRLISRVD